MTEEGLLQVIAGKNPKVPRPIVSMKILMSENGVGRGIGFVKFVSVFR
jgi:hypothetical protein